MTQNKRTALISVHQETNEEHRYSHISFKIYHKAHLKTETTAFKRKKFLGNVPLVRHRPYFAIGGLHRGPGLHVVTASEEDILLEEQQEQQHDTSHHCVRLLVFSADVVAIGGRCVHYRFGVATRTSRPGAASAAIAFYC